MLQTQMTDGESKTASSNGDRDPNYCIFVDSQQKASEVIMRFYPERIQLHSIISVEDECEDTEGSQIQIEKYNYYPPSDDIGYLASKEMLGKVLEALLRTVREFTVVVESYHVDPSFRDSYYNYFSNQHFSMSRFTQRLSFFEGDFTDRGILWKTDVEDLNSKFLGTCVVYPNDAHTLGRLLFKPFALRGYGEYHLRLTDYSITVFGIRLHLRAFPHQMQDRETTRCAEITLLNLLDYFSATYREYSIYKPSDILQAEKALSPDRTLPSRGMNYYIMSQLLTKFGFSPRLYSRKAMNTQRRTRRTDEQDRSIRRLLHYYVESGIPVAVNVAYREGKRDEPSHSLLCIGHGGQENAVTPQIECHGNVSLINAADYYKKYVLIDDNQVPYAVQSFENLSCHTGMKVEYILVPLYARMFLEASDAYAIARSILVDEKYGIESRIPDFDFSKKIVVRLFMASTRTFKNYRVSHADDQDISYCELYGSIPFPRFVWVAECFTEDEFKKNDGLAFGEIVLDATSSTQNDMKSVIMISFPNSVSVRAPEQPVSSLNILIKDFRINPFPRFKGNLEQN